MTIGIILLVLVLVVIVKVFNSLDGCYVVYDSKVRKPEWDLTAICHNHALIVQAKKIPVTHADVERGIVLHEEVGEEFASLVEDD